MDIETDIKRFIQENPHLFEFEYEEEGRYIPWGVHDVPHSEETKKLISEKLQGNSNALGKNWTNPESHKIASKNRMLDANPMNNPESVEKCRKKALIKYPCPNCGKEMNKGNLSRHIPLCT